MHSSLVTVRLTSGSLLASPNHIWAGLSTVQELAKMSDIPDLSNYATKDDLNGLGGSFKYEAGYKSCTTAATIFLDNAFDFVIISGRTYRGETGYWFIYENTVTISKVDLGRSNINYSKPTGTGSIITEVTSVSSKTISVSLAQATGNTNYVCWISFYS